MTDLDWATAQKIDACIDVLEAMALAIHGVAREAADAEVAYELEMARQRVACRVENPKLSIPACEDQALLVCENQFGRSLIAKHALDAARSAMRAQQARLDGLRTQSAAYRGIGS